MDNRSKCCGAEKVTARVVGDVPSLGYFVCLMAMAILGALGLGVAGLGLVDLLATLWEVMP